MQDMIATAGQSWRQMEEELRLIHDLTGGTAAMRRAGARWLPREEAESWNAWRARLNRSVLFNGVGRLVQVLSGTPFRQDVELNDADGAIVKIADNMDGKQMSLTDFMRQLLTAMLIDGMVYIQVDSAKTGGQPYFIIRRANEVIGAVADGDNADATRNNYFTRFRANAPLVKTEMTFTEPPTNWGRSIHDIGVEIIVKLGTKIVAQSRKLSIGTKILTTTLINFSGNTSHTEAGFHGLIKGKFSRVHHPRPGHSQLTAGCTQSYSISFEFRPVLPTSLSESDASLYFEFRLNPVARNLTTSVIGGSMLDTFTVKMDSLS